MKKLIILLYTIYGILHTAPEAQAATLSLSPTSSNLVQGNQATLTLSLDPQGSAVIGTDIILTYNPQYLSVISVVNLDAFSGNPKTIIDNPAGITKFSLTENYGVTQNVPAAIANITIQGLNPISSTPLTLSFTPGSTTDTNVAISGGQDVLTSVTNATITVNSPSNPPDPTSTPTPSPSVAPTGSEGGPTPTKKVLPPGIQTRPTNDKRPNDIPPGLSDRITPTPNDEPNVVSPTFIPFGQVLGTTNTPGSEGYTNALGIFALLTCLAFLVLAVFLFKKYTNPRSQDNPH